jgi:hypothetical protein
MSLWPSPGDFMRAKPEAVTVWIEDRSKRKIPKARCVVIGGDTHNAGGSFHHR